MQLTLGFSPCPNDTFIFDALVNKKIDTRGYTFDVLLEDVQTLNQWALQGKLDVSKISYGVLPLVLPHYKMLHSGGALGKGVGPLLIAAKPLDISDKLFDINKYIVAIPGENTTAHLLFTQAFPQAKHKKFLVFNEIEERVLQNENMLGVIIHENRFTYQQKGLHKLIDLGAYWEEKTSFPIPLGGIAVRRSLPAAEQTLLEQLIAESIRYAFDRYPELPLYVAAHSQEMEPSVMRQHIDLYVNDYSVHLGDDGKKAVEKFIDIFEEAHPGVITYTNIFI